MIWKELLHNDWNFCPEMSAENTGTISFVGLRMLYGLSQHTKRWEEAPRCFRLRVCCYYHVPQKRATSSSGPLPPCTVVNGRAELKWGGALNSCLEGFRDGGQVCGGDQGDPRPREKIKMSTHPVCLAVRKEAQVKLVEKAAGMEAKLAQLAE